jgi:hypothetical protein
MSGIRKLCTQTAHPAPATTCLHRIGDNGSHQPTAIGPGTLGSLLRWNSPIAVPSAFEGIPQPPLQANPGTNLSQADTHLGKLRKLLILLETSVVTGDRKLAANSVSPMPLTNPRLRVGVRRGTN